MRGKPRIDGKPRIGPTTKFNDFTSFFLDIIEKTLMLYQIKGN
jgi:hypothetical protein